MINAPLLSGLKILEKFYFWHYYFFNVFDQMGISDTFVQLALISE